MYCEDDDNYYDDDYEDDRDEDDLRDEYEYYDEWLDRDSELSDMSLEDYNESRCQDDYGLTEEESGYDDED